MENGQKLGGIVVTILGAALFIVSMGELLLKVVGGLIALRLIDYGLQMQGLPSLRVYIIRTLGFRN